MGVLRSWLRSDQSRKLSAFNQGCAQFARSTRAYRLPLIETGIQAARARSSIVRLTGDDAGRRDDWFKLPKNGV
jgi:hypothetical protein